MLGTDLLVWALSCYLLSSSPDSGPSDGPGSLFPSVSLTFASSLLSSSCLRSPAELYGLSIKQIEYAAEIAIEHLLGLTCDPIRGLVQIPCIERNAVAAMRAINAVNLANFLSDTRKISLDLIIKTMYETGRDISKTYKETTDGGLAKLYD